MEFLVLAPTPTWPADLGGRKGIVSMHESLRRHGRIHFVLYGAEGEWRDGYDEEAMAGMQRQWDSFHLIPPTRPVHTWPHGVDHGVDEWWDPAIGDYLSWRMQRGSFNALIVHYTWLSKALTYAPRTVHKVLYTADRFGGRREMFESRGFQKEFFHLDAQGEAEALHRADTVIAVKEEEEAYFDTLAPGRAITLPHYEAPIPIKPAASDPKVLRIGMIGGYNTINRANFESFLEVATKTFGRAFAPIEIVVAGGMCDALTELNNPYVKLVGYVDELSDFYGSVDAVIVPMIWSSGIKIKFAEAIAAGVPTLSTAHAAEGYVTHHPLMRCEDFEGLAEACVKVAYDRSLLDDLRKAADKSFLDAQRRLTEGVDLLASRIAAANPTYAIFSNACLLDTGSYTFGHLWSMVTYSCMLLPTTVVLPANANISARALRKLKSFVPVVQGDEVRTLDISKCAGVTIHEWRDDLPEILAGYAGDIFVCTAAGAVKETVAALRKAAPAATMVVQRSPYGGGGMSREDARHVEHYSVPMFHKRSGAVEQAWRDQHAHHDTLHILANAETIGLARFLAAQAVRWRPTAKCAIIDADGDQAALVERFSRPGLAGPRPRGVIDLAGAAPMDALREIYWRSAVPVITPTSASDPALPRQPQLRLRPQSMAELLYVLNVALLHPDQYQELEDAAWRRSTASYANDAGWAALWRRLSSIRESSAFRQIRSELVVPTI